MGQNELLATLLPEAAISILLIAVTGISIISNLAAVLGSLFYAEDLPLLLATPISGVSFLLARLTGVWIFCSWMPLVFSIPMIAAVGLHYHASLFFYVASGVLLALLLWIPTLLAALLALPIALIISRLASRGTRILLIGFGLGAAIGALRYLPNLLSNANTPERVAHAIYTLSLPTASFLPTRWISVPLSSLLTHADEPFLLYASLLLSSILALGSATFLNYSIWYNRAFSLTRTVSTVSEARFNIVRLIDRLLPWVRPQYRAIVSSEIAAVLREWSYLFESSMLLVVGIAYLSNVRIFGVTAMYAEAEREKWQQILFFFNACAGSFFIVAIAMRLIYPSVSRDGRAAWILYSSPLELQEIVQVKRRFWLCILGFISFLLLSLSTYFITHQAATGIAAGIFGVIVSHGISGIAIGLGARYANFTWEHPSQLAASLGSFLCMLTSMALGIVDVGLLIIVGYSLSPFGFGPLLSPLTQRLVIGIALTLIFAINHLAANRVLAVGCAALKEDAR
jgi:ABC-2 type transport system permease protein